MVSNRLTNPAYRKLYLPLNSSVEDRSGNGVTVTPTAITYTENQFGKTAGSFNGTTSNIVLGQFLDNFTEFTISLNVKPKAGFSDTDRVFDARSSNINYFDIRLRTAGTYQVNIVKEGYTQAGLTAPLQTDVEAHLVFVCKENDFRLYIDGVLIDSDTSGTLLSTYGLQAFGYETFNDAAYSLMNLYNVSIYNIALTGDEIKQLYQQTVPEQTAVEKPLDVLPDKI